MGASMPFFTNHIKFLSLATLLVCLWFIIFVPGAPHSTLLPPSRLSLRPSSKANNDKTKFNTLEMLPLEEAKEYCERHRLEVYRPRQIHRKVYDLMIVNTELEWLEIRMGQMADQVDYFVIIESDKTFTDQEKPLYVRENWDRFAKYHDKMILHTLNLEDTNLNTTWEREMFSRNAMYDQVIPFLEGEQEAFKGDVLLVSDVDEIPRPDTITTLRNCEFPREVTMHTAMYYYSFQWLMREDWKHPQATYYDHKDTILPHTLRGTQNGWEIFQAGWHCSYCFSTVEEMVTKIKSFSHTEMDQEQFTDRDLIVNRVRKGKDMFDRDYQHLDRIENNPDVPQFVKNDPENYGYMLDRDGMTAGFKDYEAPEEDENDE